MKIKAAPRILIVAGLWAAALVGIVLAEGNARARGLEVALPMAAVDPRALLSGHYVRIDLRQRLEQGEQCPSGGPESKWIALRRAGDAYALAGGADSREQAQRIGPVPVRGSFNCQQPLAPPDGDTMPGWVQLDLGVDRFHISQTDALRIERVLREQSPGEETRAFAIVSIGQDGRARLKGLMIDGERLELSWL
jgi:hypothetical protein